MSNDRPASGSRWEPAAGSPDPQEQDTAAAHADAPHAGAQHADAGQAGAEHPTSPVATLAPPPPADPFAGTPSAPAGRPRRGRIRTALAALALLVVGGLGGFWIGHATASGTAPAVGPGAHQRDGVPGRGGFGDGDGDGGRGGFRVGPDDQNGQGGTGTGGTGSATGTGATSGTGAST